MKVVEIIPDVTVTYSEGSEFEKILHEMEMEKRDKEIEVELRNYFSTLSPKDEEYSDIYKDLFEVRPYRHHLYTN